MYARLLLLILVILSASCFNAEDYDIHGVTMQPNFAVPVASGEMGLVHLLTNVDSSYIRAYPDGLLYFYYSQTLASSDIRDAFSIPDNISLTEFDLPAGTLPANSGTVSLTTINKQINLGLSPERLTEAMLKGGSLNFIIGLSQVTSPPNLPIQATVTLTDVVHKTTGAPLVFTANAGTGSVPLQDYVIHMVDNGFTIAVDMKILPHPDTFIPAGTKANVQLGFTAMHLGYIRGFLGDQTFQLPPQTQNISVFGSSLKDAGVSFVTPHVSMRIVNDYGASCEVNFTTLRATKGASTLPIQISPVNPITLNSPAVLGQSATTNISITNEQSIVSFAPEQLEYTAAVRINKGLASGSNFLADTSKLRVTLDTEIPLYGKVSGVTMIDTLTIDLGSNISASKILDASVGVNVQNELPLDGLVQIYFMKANFNIKDSLFTPNQTYIVKASTVDAAGDLISPGLTSTKVGLDPEKLVLLFDSKYLIVKAVMSTGRDQNNQQLNVKFRSSYKLKINVGLQSKFNVSLD